MSKRLSVCLTARNNSASIARIFMQFDIWVFFSKSLTKIQVTSKSGRISGTLQEDHCTFVIISRSFVLIIRNFSEKLCTENQNTHFMFSESPPENRVAYEIMWKNTIEQRRSQMAIQHGACATYAGYLNLQTHTRSK